MVYPLQRKKTYSIVRNEHGDGSSHETIEKGDKHDGARDADRDVVHRVLDLLGHGRHGVIANVAKINHRSTGEHTGDSIRNEATWVLGWVQWLCEVLQ